MGNDGLDYSAFVDSAMRGVVRDILRQVQRIGLPGNHHFFISFRTDYPGVMMSESLRSKYPEEITIVMQHQFWDLFVAEDHFKIALSFSNVPEKLFVPFAALTGFADPSTKFGLQFHSEEVESPVALPSSGAPQKTALPAATGLAAVGTEDSQAKASAEIITLDAWRKK